MNFGGSLKMLFSLMNELESIQAKGKMAMMVNRMTNMSRTHGKRFSFCDMTNPSSQSQGRAHLFLMKKLAIVKKATMTSRMNAIASAKPTR